MITGLLKCSFRSDELVRDKKRKKTRKRRMANNTIKENTVMLKMRKFVRLSRTKPKTRLRGRRCSRRPFLSGHTSAEEMS